MSASDRPRIARHKAYYTELEPDRDYYWCSCGNSQVQPFCDGSHAKSGLRPVRYRPQYAGEEVLFCGCKHTGTPPFCDGSHNGLLEDYPEDDPESPENLRIPWAITTNDGRSVLNGGCYVVSPGSAELKSTGTLRYCTVVGPEFGAIHQSQYYFEVGPGVSPVISFGAREIVLFVSGGDLDLEISGRDFSAPEYSGVYIARGEAFRVSSARDRTVRFLASVSPRATEPEFGGVMPSDFDDRNPERVVPLDPSQRHAMANRYFQMLVDKTVGSRIVAQFIGHIPLSKAEAHRHLYEEALIILSGEGCMWTENLKAPVKAGDVIFLPGKQLHSLEATNGEGMMVVGTICPGDNPAINY